MFEFRVTKYDPRFRLADNSYARSEWTSVSDIGRAFEEGVVLTRQEYERVESAYVGAAQSFLSETGIPSVRIRGLERYGEAHPQFVEGAVIPVEGIKAVLTALLWEELWCRLEAPDAFVHVGYDYYMYVGVPSACPFAQRRVATLGLFVEPFQSPYHDETAA